MDFKQCSKCRQTFEGAEIELNFSKLWSTKDGLQRNCKVCLAEAKKLTRNKKKFAGICTECNSPLFIGSSTMCFSHHVLSRYYASHSKYERAKRQAQVTVVMSAQLEAKWVEQGGNPDGSGYAICPTTGRQISFEDGSASLGHINANLSGDQFADPFNVCWESKQANLSNQTAKQGQRKESPQKFNMWARSRPFSAATIKQLWYAKPQVCPYTGYQLQYTYEAQLDHIVPKSQGGSDELSNLQFISAEANSNKRNLSHDQFVEKLIQQGRLTSWVPAQPLG